MTRLRHLHNLLLLLLLQLTHRVSASSTAEDRQDVFLQCLNSLHHADTDHDNKLTRTEFRAFAVEFSGQLYPHPIFTDGYLTNELRDLFSLLIEAGGGEAHRDISMSVYGSAIEDLINVDQERFDTLHKICRMAENAFALLAQKSKPPKTMVMEFTMVEGNMNDEDGMTVKIKPLLDVPGKKKKTAMEVDEKEAKQVPNDSGIELHGTHLSIGKSKPKEEDQSTTSSSSDSYSGSESGSYSSDSWSSDSDSSEEEAPKPKIPWDMSNATNSTPPLPYWMNNTNTTLREKLEHHIAHRNDTHNASSESIVDENWHKVHQNSVYTHNKEKLEKVHKEKVEEKKAKHQNVVKQKEKAKEHIPKKKQTHVPDGMKNNTNTTATSESDSEEEAPKKKPPIKWDMSNATNTIPPLPYWMNTTNTTLRDKLEYTLLHRNDSTYDSSDESIDEIWHKVHQDSVYKHNQEKLQKEHKEKVEEKKAKHQNVVDQKEKAKTGMAKKKQTHVPDHMKNNNTNATKTDDLDEYVEETKRNQTKTKDKLKTGQDKIDSIEEDIEDLIQDQTDLVLEHLALPDIEDSWEDSSDSEDFSFVWDEAFRQQQYQKNKKELEELKKALNREKIHLGKEKGDAMEAKVKSLVVSNFTPGEEDFLRGVDGPESKTAQRDDGKKKPPPPPKKEEEDTTGMRKKPDFDAPPEGPDSKIADRNETLPSGGSSGDDSEGEDDFDSFVINEAQIHNQQKKNQEYHNKTAGNETLEVSGSDEDDSDESGSYSSDSDSSSGSWSSDSDSDSDSDSESWSSDSDSDSSLDPTTNETLTIELSDSIDSLEDYADFFDDDDDDEILLDESGDDKQILSLHTSFVIFNFENKTGKDIDIGENSTLHHAFEDFLYLIIGTVCDKAGMGRAFGNCSGISKVIEKELEEEVGDGSDEEGNTRRKLLEEEQEIEEKDIGGGLRATGTSARQLDGGEFRKQAGINFDYTILNPELYDIEDIECPMAGEFPYKAHAPSCQTVFAHYNLLLNGLDGKIRQVEHNYMIITAKGIEHGRLRDSLQMIDPLSIHHVEGVGQRAFPTVHAYHPEHLQTKADEAEKKKAEKEKGSKSSTSGKKKKTTGRKAALDQDPDDPNWENLLKMEGYKVNPEGLYAEDQYENSLVDAVNVIKAGDDESSSRALSVEFLVALTSTLAMNLWLILV